MADHIVSAFDLELKRLTSKLSEMGGRAESMVSDGVSALVRMDASLARDVVKQDLLLDTLQREIDESAILTIAKQQPMAEDLRMIISAIRISNDLERIGDLAKNIARRVRSIEGQVHNMRYLNGMDRISDLSLAQLKDVLDAMTSRDSELARAVWLKDDAVDNLYTSLFRELLTYMMEDPRNITFCTHLLFCAKNIERIGDHATNIAETVMYMVTGQNVMEGRTTRDEENVLPIKDGMNEA